MLELKTNGTMYTERTLHNVYSYNTLQTSMRYGGLSIEYLFDLCDIIQKKQKELENLHKTLVKTQYIVVTEETIELIKKEV